MVDQSIARIKAIKTTHDLLLGDLRRLADSVGWDTPADEIRALGTRLDSLCRVLADYRCERDAAYGAVKDAARSQPPPAIYDIEGN